MNIMFPLSQRKRLSPRRRFLADELVVHSNNFCRKYNSQVINLLIFSGRGSSGGVHLFRIQQERRSYSTTRKSQTWQEGKLYQDKFS